MEQLGLNQKVLDGLIDEFQQAIPKWRELISYSFLSPLMQEKYLSLLEERCRRLDLRHE